MKKYLSVILALVILITPMTNVMGVSAVVYSQSEYDDIIDSLISNLETYESNYANVQDRQGIYTQLYQGRQIFCYATFVYAAAYSAEHDKVYRKSVGGLLSTYATRLSEMIVEYNVSYFATPGEYLGDKFPQKGDEEIDITKLGSVIDKDVAEACPAVESWCIAIAKQYIVKTLEAYAKTVDTSDEEKTKEEYGSLCAEIYKGLDYGLSSISDANAIMGISKKDKIDLNKGYAFKSTTVETRIKKDIKKYEAVYTIGHVIVAVDKYAENIISIDPTKTLLENMADVYVEQDESNPDYGMISIEEQPHLSLAYIGALASSATYTPFESYVGDSRFIDALDSLCQSQEAATLLNSYYNSLKLYKKPLYFRSLNSVGNPEGQAELKSIKEIFELIKSGAAGSLCTINGNLCVNTNTGDWVYTTEQLDSSLAYSLKSNMKEAEQTESTLGDAAETDDTISSGDYKWDKLPNFTASQKPEANDVAKEVYNQLKKEGFSDAAICGILGNIQQECSFDITNDEGDYWGLCQWGSGWKTKDLGNFHAKWATVKNDKNAQVKFLVDTLKEDHKRVADKIKNLNDPTEACVIFCAEYEGCYEDTPNENVKAFEYQSGVYKYWQELPERVYYAKQFYEKVLPELRSAYSTSTASNKQGSSVLSRLTNSLISLGIIKTVLATPVTDDTTTTDTTTTDTTTTDTTTEDEDTVDDTDVPDVDNEGTNIIEEDVIQDSADKVITDYSAKPKDFKDAISAARIISDESRMNGPVLLFGSVYQRDIDNMTTAIYSNVLNSAGDYNINNIDSEYLYVNAFGDIVTASDLVIFPGILNPILYADGIAYNPYTVAFMNSYPANIRNSAYYMLSSKSDVGKYCLFLDTLESNEAEAISTYNNSDDSVATLVDGDYEFALLNSITGVKNTQTLLSRPLYNKFIYGDFEKAATFRLQKYLFSHKINRKAAANTYIPLIENSNIYANNKQVFPYDYTKDTDSTISKIIANNMYQYLTTDFVTKEIGNQSKFNDNWILHYILISGYEGTSDISSYKNNFDISYDGYTMSSSSRVISQIVEFSEKLFSSISSVNCVLGLQNSYEDILLGKIVTAVRSYWLIFYIVFLLFILVAVMRAKKDLLQSGFLVITCSIAAYAFVYFVPVYLPMFYNLAVNNISDRVAYEVLIQSNEYNEGTADNIVDVDAEGRLKYNTSSITLYRMPSAQLERYYSNLGISLREATGGSSFVIDQYAGFFVEGDSLKMSTDVLFGTLSIKEDPSTGQLHAYKTTSNNVDYYIPYYQLVDSLVDKMNRITKVYDINHSTVKLRNGSRVNNFRTYTYFNSPIFINPEAISAELELDLTGWSEDEIHDYTKKQTDIMNALQNEFGENKDWLGLYDILVTNALKPDSNFQDTLWFKTMCDVGYYRNNGNGWVADEDNLNALIYYVNYQTKNFVYDIKDYIGDVSDEAILEIVALRAVIALTQEASDFTHWLYPFSINYSEFDLGSVEISTFVERYSDYVKNNYSLVKYINDKYGWFNLIIFDLVSILLFVITWLIKILATLFYVLLLVILIIRMFGDCKYSTVVKGFLKCSTAIMVILLLQVMAITISSKLVGNVISIYTVLGFSMLAIYLLVVVITSVIFNFVDFGNSALNAKVTGITSMVQNLKNISINTTNLRRVRPEINPAIVTPQERLSQYDFDVDIDDQYNRQIDDMPENTSKAVEPELDFYQDSDNVVDETSDYDF